MHGHIPPASLHSPFASDPKALRIAQLSEEYLNADPARQDAIGQEVAGLIGGQIVPLRGEA